MTDDADGGPTRRALLAAGGAALAASAGCTTGGADGDADRTFAYPLRSPVEATQFNPWLTGFPRPVTPLFFAYRSTVRVGEGRRFGHLIRDVAVDGETATVRYDDGYTWWNGDPVTARDDYVRVRLGRLLREAGDEPRRRTRTTAARFDPRIELIDDETLRYEFDEALHPDLVRSVVADGMLGTPAWLYEEWVERFESATTDGARRAERDAFRERQVPFEELVERGAGCGPFRPTELVESRVECERFEDHPAADAIGVERVDLLVTRGTRERQLLVNGDLDAGQRRLSDLGDAVPSSIEQLDRYRLVDGIKLLCNWDGPLADRRVRWGVAAAIPLDDVAANSGLGPPARRQTGLGTPAESEWLPDDVDDRLYDHPREAAPDRAGDHFAAAGYERSGGRWRDDDGRRLTLVLRTPTRTRWQVAARTVREALRAAGVEVRLLSHEFGSFHSAVTDGSYDLALWWAAGSPFEAYDVASPALSGLGYGVSDPDADEVTQGRPVAPSVPAEVTGPDATDGERVNLVERWEQLRTAESDGAARDAVATFARWWNADLPDVQLVDGEAALWGDTRDFDWPERGDPALRTFGSNVRPELHALVSGAVSEA